VKACPTQALSFGSKEDMLELAHHRLEDLHERGLAKAGVYDPAGVGGTHVVFVLPHADRPEAYGLPAAPRISTAVTLWRSGFSKMFGIFTIFAVLAAAFLHYLGVGPLEVHEEKNKEKEKEGDT
jgi:formate dehydrogenase iron-sulfur subunit